MIKFEPSELQKTLTNIIKTNVFSMFFKHVKDALLMRFVTKTDPTIDEKLIDN